MNVLLIVVIVVGVLAVVALGIGISGLALHLDHTHDHTHSTDEIVGFDALVEGLNMNRAQQTLHLRFEKKQTPRAPFKIGEIATITCNYTVAEQLLTGEKWDCIRATFLFEFAENPVSTSNFAQIQIQHSGKTDPEIIASNRIAIAGSPIWVRAEIYLYRSGLTTLECLARFSQFVTNTTGSRLFMQNNVLEIDFSQPWVIIPYLNLDDLGDDVYIRLAHYEFLPEFYPMNL